MPVEAKLVLAGLLVGALVGLTGMGGGAVMTPLLIFLGIPATTAVGTDLAFSAFTKTLGAWRHHSLSHVNYRIAFWLAAGSVPAAVLGVLTLKQLQNAMGDDVDGLIQALLGASLVLVGLTFALKTLVLKPKEHEREIETRVTSREKVMAVGIGLGFGYLLGLTSVGSGTFFGMALVLLFHLRAARVVGTDIFHAAMLVWAAAIAHAVITQTVQFGTVGWLLAGSIPGILIGAQGTSRAPERLLRGCIAAVLGISGISLLLAH
jgi:uncharacterized membrane protein YfcA